LRSPALLGALVPVMVLLASAGAASEPGPATPGAERARGPDPLAARLREYSLGATTEAVTAFAAIAIGRSAQGRPIRLRASVSPWVRGRVLVFGCIHGTECAATGVRPNQGGCPPNGDVFLVPNLNPDGLAEGVRTNARGVDLNRNFPAAWRQIGRRGDPQHSGPRPFSEPETRLAARLIRHLRPEITIWFHQHSGPAYVRAWGQSAPVARRFARLAGLPFHAFPWLAGTAPNWQNHRFPGTASFVVELAPGSLAPQRTAGLGSAIGRLAEVVDRD
jgi:murein peptide amidase A